MAVDSNSIIANACPPSRVCEKYAFDQRAEANDYSFVPYSMMLTMLTSGDVKEREGGDVGL